MGVLLLARGSTVSGGPGGGAPTDALYVVGAAHVDLTAELVLGSAVIMAGTEAARPAASLAGRLYFATDTLRLFRDTGAAWTTVSVGALAELAERAHSSLTGVGIDDHHARDHAIGGATHSGAITAAQHGALAAIVGAHGHDDLDTVTADQHHAQAHDLDGADHTIAGEVAGEFLRATGAAAFAMETVPFSVSMTLLDPDAARNVMVWRAPFACTVTNVRGHIKGATGSTVNARRNQASNHLAAALTLSATDTWTDGGAVQNTAYVAGDDLELMVVSISGVPTEIALQVDFTRP